MNKTLKYIVLLTFACLVGKGYAQELKSEVFSLLNLDYPGLEKVKALHQEGKNADAAKALLDYYRARTNVKKNRNGQTTRCNILSLYTKVINLLIIMEKTSTGNIGR